jgi:AcrR family transcriptional regulator
MSTTPRSSRLDPGERREQILDAANALSSERGYDEVSIEEVAGSAGVTRGLVYHYFGGRKQVYIALLQRLGAVREAQLPPPTGRSARARLADTASRWLDWTEQNRTIWLATLGRGKDIADPDVRQVVTELVRRAVAIVAARPRRNSRRLPRLRYALECWTGLNRAATRRWLQGEATREQTHERLTSIARTRSSNVRRPGAKPGADPLPDMRTVEFRAIQRPRCQRLIARSPISLPPNRGSRGAWGYDAPAHARGRSAGARAHLTRFGRCDGCEAVVWLSYGSPATSGRRTGRRAVFHAREADGDRR